MNARAQRLVLVGVLAALFALSLAYYISGNVRSGMSMGNLISSALLLAVPLGLLYWMIGLVWEAWRVHRAGGQLTGGLARSIYLAPRISGVAVAVFTGLFALDVFDMEGSLWMKIGAFFIHAAPALIMLALVALAWRREWIGALIFGLGALFFLRFVVMGGMFAFGNLLLFCLPMALVAVLYWLNWRWRGEIRRGLPAARGGRSQTGEHVGMQ
jgi:hypothetical protein